MLVMDPRLRDLSGDDLISRVRDLAHQDHQLKVEMVAHLAEVEYRGLYAREGWPSMFDWLTKDIEMSNGTAQRRLDAARAVIVFPRVRRAFELGLLTLTAVSLIFRPLRDGLVSEEELLPDVIGATTNEIREVLAMHSPLAALRPATMRPIAYPTEAARDEAARDCEEGGEETGDRSDEYEVGARFEFDASEAFVAKYEKARSLMYGRCTVPEVLEAALDEYLERNDPEARQRRREKRREAKAKKEEAAGTRPGGSVPRSDQGTESGSGGESERRVLPERHVLPGAGSRHIPAEIADLVWIRDGGRCSFIGENGKRCCATTELEIDHEIPFALGGRATLDNLRLRCRAHNQMWAEEVFGREMIERCRTRTPGREPAADARSSSRGLGSTQLTIPMKDPLDSPARREDEASRLDEGPGRG